MFLDFLKELKIDFIPNKDLSKKSYFKIGGNCILVRPKNQSELINSVAFLDENTIPYNVAGMMSNILVGFDTHDEIIIDTTNVNDYFVSGQTVTASCGCRFSTLIRSMAELNLELLPSLIGIPGTVGGMVYNNAGAFGAEISDAFLYGEFYDITKKTIVRLTKSEIGFAYRESIMKAKGMLLLTASFLLNPADKTAIVNKISRTNMKRKMSQPTIFSSAGSVFKRPKGTFAAKLIDSCGLKGFRIGGAAVSFKHAGFIINLGHATFSDVLRLISIIRNRVYRVYGIHLEEEIEIWK